MGYVVKKTYVLKTASGEAAGIMRTESMNGETDFILPECDKTIIIYNGKVKEFFGEHGKKLSFSLPFSPADVSAIVCFTDNDRLFTSPDKTLNYEGAKRIYENYVETTRRQTAEHTADEYDDYAVAETNYYALERGEKVNDKTIQDAEKQKDFARQKGKDKSADYGKDNAYDSLFSEKQEYLRKKLANLNYLFRRAGQSKLSFVIPNSLWIKDERGLLGIIGDRFSPDYVCLATADTPSPPETLFVPESVFDDKLGGYGVTFLKIK